MEIILVLAGIPLGIFAVLALLTLGPHIHRTPRYRPGQPWHHPPVWWTANPEALREAQHHHPASRVAAPRGGCRGEW